MNLHRLIGVTSLSIPIVGFVGCSSSSSTESPGEDSGATDDGSSTVDGIASSSSGGGSSSGSSSSGASSGSSGGDSGHPPTGDAGDGGGIAQKVAQTNLFADTSDGGAPNVDPNLVNAWGLAFSPTGIAWISDNGPGLATLYGPSLSAPLPKVVNIPAPAGSPSGSTGTPSGQIFNPGGAATDAGPGDFKGDTFILSTEDGTVAGWSNASDPFNDAGVATATIEFDNSAAGAVYKGLAIDPTTPPILLLADFHNGRIDALDRTYAKITTDGGTAWTDPSVPSGFNPFNIVVSSSQVYVAYAKLGPGGHDDFAGDGNGAVSVFDTSGTLVKSLVKTGGALNSPWALAMAPSGWGQLGGMLLVGNFGDGHVNAYDPTSGAWVGSLATTSGAPLAIDGLWALKYGVQNPDAGITSSQLYFTAGPNAEANGLFGYLTAQ
jgi:uncharacterized protein (TIGR03118 family)